ncbi:MAG: glycoside hydrolase family 2 protein [Saccharofermentanales bacterium]
MKSFSLNGNWKIRWTNGQRGGSPHYIKEPGQQLDADLLGDKKEITDDYDSIKWIDAAVPGEVHLDLLKAGLIEDPYIKANILKCRWVEEFMWYYRKVFDAPAASQATSSFLRFDGLDYGALVYLNGKEIGRHENAFYPLLIDISGKLEPEGNVLVVRLESGLYSVSEKKVTDLYSATMGVDNLLHKRMWLRKPQFSTEWDWSSRLLNVGIFKDVSLLYSDIVIVSQCQLRTAVASDLQSASLELRFFLETEIPEGFPVTLSLKIDGSDHPAAISVRSREICAAANVAEPQLWFPHGYGPQPLYRIEYSLSISGKEVYSGTKTTGFRHFEVDQRRHPVEGSYFTFKVNGIQVFAKGSNFVPCDMIIAAIDYDRYDRITDLALEANFNILRVWGGGLYESDDFFGLCDRKGILVWQEFISACSTLPYNDKEFADSFHREAIYNIRRLSHYPSLIAWCGNNEVDVHSIQAFKNYDCLPQDTPLYYEVLPVLLRCEDPDKYYQPASPYSIDGSCTGNDLVGDQHPWAVGFINKDHRDYRSMKCRFPNEGGILGPTSLDTIRQSLSEDQQFLHSFEWDVHDNMLENWMPGTSSDSNVRFWLDLDPRKLLLDEAVYALGMVQAEGLVTYIDSFRSKKFDTSAAIFWMYNDCWPATISWTIVDYYLRRTPAFHSVRKAFAPLRSIVVDTGAGFGIMVNNDAIHEGTYVLKYGAFDCGGNYLVNEEIGITAAANSCAAYALIPEAEGITPLHIVFSALYTCDGQMISQNRYLTPRFFELPLEKSTIESYLDGEYTVFESGRFVLGACTGIEDDDNIADNLFDLFPNVPYRVNTNGRLATIRYTVNDLLGKYR